MPGTWINAPMCIGCWNKKNPDRQVVHLIKTEREICLWCDAITYAGIYVRTETIFNQKLAAGMGETNE